MDKPCPEPSANRGSGPEADTLEGIVEVAHDLLRLPIAIWLPLPGTGSLVFRAGAGLAAEVRAGFVEHGGGEIPDRVLATGRPASVGDLRAHDRSGWWEHGERAGWKSTLALPIEVHGRSRGVFQVFSGDAGELAAPQTASLERLADLAGAVLEGARRAAESEELARLAKTVSAQPDFESAMQVIAGSARQLVQADSSTIVLIDSRTQSFRVGHRTPPGPAEMEPRPEHLLTQHLLDTGMPVRVVDTEDDGRVSPELRAQGIRSLIGVRLELEGERFGVLYADGRQRDQFGEHELHLLRMVADQASVALGWTRRLLEPWVVIERSSEHLFQRDSILERFCQEIDHRLGFDFSTVQLVRRDRRLIETFFATGIARRWEGRSRHYLHPEADLRDIQADIALARPLRTEILRGWDPRFDRGIFTEFQHDKLVRLFTPLVVVRTPEGHQVEDWPELFDERILLDEREVHRQHTVLELMPGDGAAALEIEVIGTVEAGYDDAGRELGPAQARALIRLAAAHAGDIRKTLLRHVAETIVEQARQVARADSASLHYSFDTDQHRYLNEVRSGDLTASFLDAHPPRSGGLGDRAIRDREPKLLPDPARGDDDAALARERPDLAALGIEAMAAFPLLVGSETGILYLHFKRRYQFRDEEIRWVKLLASRAADAIRQATAYTESHDRARQLAFLQWVVQDLVQGLGEPELGPKIARNALNMLAADVVTIYEFNQSERRFVTPPAIAGRLREEGAMRTQIGQVDAPALLVEHDADLFVEAGVKGHPILDRPGRHRPGRHESFVSREGIKSCAGVRLKVAGETVGVIFINYRRPHHFSADDRTMSGALASLASAAAIAIKNQRLLAKLQEDLHKITHEIQMPLVAINALLATLTKTFQRDLAAAVGTGAASQFREFLDHAHALSQDVLALSGGILHSFTREAGQRTVLNVVAIDVPAELTLLCERLRRTNDRDDLQCIVIADPGFPDVRCDRMVFNTVMYNLVHNAMKYSAPGSEVRILCHIGHSGTHVQVAVHSVGERIDPQDAERIFEKFGRGRLLERTGRLHAGVGLGLWVAREAMRAAGGDILLELPHPEPPPGQPSPAAFVVEIPQQPAPSTPNGRRHEAAEPEPRRRG